MRELVRKWQAHPPVLINPHTECRANHANEPVESLGGVLGASWGVLGASWSLLEGLGGVLGASWRPLGGCSGSLGGLLGVFWELLEASWRLLGAIWRHLGKKYEKRAHLSKVFFRFGVHVGAKNPTPEPDFRDPFGVPKDRV